MTHTEKALLFFAQGFQCSQAVFAAFSEETGISETQALKIGACFGGGMCKGEVCGACSGALMVLGMLFGYSDIGDAEGKAKTNQIAEQFLDAFKEEQGSYLCKDILGCNLAENAGRIYAKEQNLFTAICPQMVASAVKIVEKIIEENTSI